MPRAPKKSTIRALLDRRKEIHELWEAMQEVLNKPPQPPKRPSRMTPYFLQKVLDHVGGLGKVTGARRLPNGWYSVHSTDGHFVVSVHPDSKTITEIERNQLREHSRLGPKLRRSDRILLPDIHGRRRRVSSYVHAMGMYFAIYRIRDPGSRGARGPR